MKKKMFLLTILCTTLFSCAKDELMPSDREDGKIEIKTVVISEGGIITKAETTAGKTTGGGLYATGQNCVVKAIPNSGYTLDKFEGSNVEKIFSGSDTYDFRVTKPTTFSASFKKTETQGICYFKVNDASLGSVQPSVEFNIKDWWNDTTNATPSSITIPIQMNEGVRVTSVDLQFPGETATYSFECSFPDSETIDWNYDQWRINKEKAYILYKSILEQQAQTRDDFYTQSSWNQQGWETCAWACREIYLKDLNSSLPTGTTIIFNLSKKTTPVVPVPPIYTGTSTITLKTDCSGGQVSLDGVTWGKSVSITVPSGTKVGLRAYSSGSTSYDGFAFIGFDGVWSNNSTSSDNGGNSHTTTSGSYDYVANGNETINATFQYQRWGGTFDGM